MEPTNRMESNDFFNGGTNPQMQRQNNNFISQRFSSPPASNSKQRRLLKLSRKKRASEMEGIIKAEHLNGFRGNDSLESLVEYIEGIPAESLSTTKQQQQQQPLKEKDSKNKKKPRKVAVSTKNGKKTKKIVCLEEEPISESVNGDCDLEIHSLPPEISRRSCDDSDDGADTPIPVQSLMLFSPKSDENYSPSSCSVDGVVDIDNSLKKPSTCYDSVQKYVNNITVERKISNAVDVPDENASLNVAKPPTLLVKKQFESSVPCEETGKKDARKTIIAQNSSANRVCDKGSGFVVPVDIVVLNYPRQNENVDRPKDFPISQCCRFCHPSKVHVEFLDEIEQRNAISPPYDDSNDLKDLSFGCDEFFSYPPMNDTFSIATPPVDREQCLNKQVSSSAAKIALERAVDVPKKEQTSVVCCTKDSNNLHFVTEVNQRKFSSPMDKRNEKVRRDVKDFLNKRWNAFMRSGEIIRY